MGYITQYCVCAFVILFIVYIAHAQNKTLNTGKDRIFVWFLILGLLTTSMDLLYVGAEIAGGPDWLLVASNIICQVSLHAIPALMVKYFLILDGSYNRLKFIEQGIIWVPFAIQSSLIISSAWTGWIFYIENALYFTGPIHSTLYIFGGGYILISAGIAIKGRKKIGKGVSTVMLSFLAAIMAVMVLQFYYPKYLLIEFSIAIAMLSMYLTLESPALYVAANTESFNRKALVLLANERFVRNRHFAVVVYAMNGFTRINALFGENKGDEILTQLLKYLGKIYNTNYIIRMHGDYLCVLVDCEDKKCIGKKCIYQPENLIVHPLPETVMLDGLTVPVSAETVIITSNLFTNIDEMVSVIEFSVHEAKKNSDGKPIRVDEIQCKRHLRYTQIEAAVAKAIREQTFTVNYQPIISVKDGKVFCAEALVRLTDPILGVISPSEFIPVSEACGLIKDVGRIVREQVCEFISKYDISSRYGVSHISTNLSTVECLNTNLADEVLGLIKSKEIPISSICIEITETAADYYIEATKLLVNTLNSAGIRFYIDDYGTGNSNMFNLFRLPFSIVKIDRHVFYAAISDKVNEDLLRHVIDSLRNSEKKIICEGIETLEQLELAKAWGIDYIQGFLYSRPLDGEAFIKFLEEHNPEEIPK